MREIDAKYDMLIVGGGLVGATLALALRVRSGNHFRIALIEAYDPSSESRTTHASFDARSTALSLSSQRFYVGLNLWAQIEVYAQPIRRIHVSDRGRFGSVLLDSSEEGMPALGYVVENARLGQVLYQALSLSGVEVLMPATLCSVETGHRGYAVKHIDSGRQTAVSTGLLIISDGADSSTCRQLGIRSEVRSLGQTAVVANVVHQNPHEGMAYERFTRHGPMALLPMTNDSSGQPRSALIWVDEDAIARNLIGLSPGQFLERLQYEFGYRAGRFERVGVRASYPLRSVFSSEQVRRGVVVAGNAAHTLHPVAGQGFNLSLRDAHVLADLLCAARVKGLSPGNPSTLQRYQRCQEGDQRVTSVFSRILPELFSSANLPLAIARSAGLLGMDLLPALRSRFVRFATGLRN